MIRQFIGDLAAAVTIATCMSAVVLAMALLAGTIHVAPDRAHQISTITGAPIR